MSAIRNIDGPKDFILEFYQGSDWDCRGTRSKRHFGRNFQVFYAISSYF